jgi:hypothetical protein
MEVKTGREKHCLCRMADEELLFVSMALGKIHAFFADPSCPWAGWLSQNNFFRAPPHQLTLQARYTKLQQAVAALRCYVALRPDAVVGKEPVKEWFAGFLHAFRETRVVYRNACQDITVLILAFLGMIYTDALKHTSFGKRYAASFDSAVSRVEAELPADEAGEAWALLWKPMVLRLVRDYPFRTITGERFLLGTASLGEYAMVDLCARAFRHVLDTWDVMHDLAIPRVRRVLAVFAYEMVPLYEQKRYLLTPLFDQ